MRSNLILASLIWMFSFQLSAHVPEAVAALIKKQAGAFRSALSGLSTEQHTLVLERYAELLMESPIALEFGLKKNEVLLFINTSYPHQESVPLSRVLIGEKRSALTGFASKSFNAVGHSLQGVFNGRTLELGMSCDSKQYRLPFEFVDAKNSFVLKLRGVPVPQKMAEPESYSYCLILTFPPTGKTAHINELKTQTDACPLPAEHAGKCLLKLAEEVSRVIGMKKVSLVDTSNFRCSATKKFVDLRRLRTFQEGQSWYEKNGYVPQGDLELYHERINELKNYELKLFAKNLAELEIDAVKTKLLESHIQTYEQSMNASKTFAGFMSWLWEKDCAFYAEVDELVFNERSRFKISALYPAMGVLKKDL